MRRIDNGLELYWHPVRHRWILYRVVRRGVTPGLDYLVKELELVGPQGQYREPGSWLITWLRREDKTRGGSVDPARAARAIVAETQRRQDASLQTKRDAWADTAGQWTKEADRLVNKAQYTRSLKN